MKKPEQPLVTKEKIEDIKAHTDRIIELVDLLEKSEDFAFPTEHIIDEIEKIAKKIKKG